MPRDAATVILVRQGAADPLEVFFMRRNRNQSFMAGAFVFPGGALDPGDCDEQLLDLCEMREEKMCDLLHEPLLPQSLARGLFMAAIRETFEEAGVLLASRSGGGLQDLRVPQMNARFSAYRGPMQAKEITIKEMAVREGIRLTPEILLPYAHWITPETVTKRFDTRFFLTRVPQGQEPVHDNTELTASAWMTPSKALEEHAAGRILLMPPTLMIVTEMGAFRSVEELLAAAAGGSVLPILPQAFKGADGTHGLKMPFDRDYTIAEYKLPQRPGRAFTDYEAEWNLEG